MPLEGIHRGREEEEDPVYVEAIDLSRRAGDGDTVRRYPFRDGDGAAVLVTYAPTEKQGLAKLTVV